MNYTPGIIITTMADIPENPGFKIEVIVKTTGKKTLFRMRSPLSPLGGFTLYTQLWICLIPCFYPLPPKGVFFLNNRALSKVFGLAP
jgi:hypothetical protein